MSNGTQISDMTNSLTVLPAGSFAPFIVTDPATGLNPALNYRYDIGTYLVKYATLALSSGSSLVGYLPTGTGAVARTLQGKLRNLQFSPEDFGAVGNGPTDDILAIQKALDALSTLGGGTLLNSPGLTYRCTTAPDIKDDVTYDLNGGGLLLALSGTNDTGVRLRSNATLENGTVTVQSSGTPSTQPGVHGPVCIGALEGEGGTVGAPSVYDSVSGWTLRNLVLSSNKWVSNGGGGMVGAAAVWVSGGPNNGIIENIKVPSSAFMYGAVLMDWNYIGTLQTPTDNVTKANLNKAAFPATMYTSHPHNIRVANINVGPLTAANTGDNTGSFGVRLSGCYGIKVENVGIESCTFANFWHTAGDVGFEYAPVAIKPLACKNIRFSTGSVVTGSTAYLIYADSYADNIATAQSGGYTPLMNPLIQTNIVFQSISGTGPGDGTAQYGIRAIQLYGGSFLDCDASYYKQGVNVDEKVRGLLVSKCHLHFNREDGVLVDHSGNDPEDVTIRDCLTHDNGQGGGNHAGVRIGSSKRAKVYNNRSGAEGANDSAQVWAFRAETGAVDAEFVGNIVLSTLASTGTAYSMLSGTDFNILGLFTNNRWIAANTVNVYAGVTVIPVKRDISEDDRMISAYKMSSTVTPTGLILNIDDEIEYTNPAAAGFRGIICTTAGAVGSGAVTKTFAAISA